MQNLIEKSVRNAVRRLNAPLTGYILKYGLAGLAAVATHLLILHVLVRFLSVDPVLASALGFVGSLPVNFLMQQYVVFKQRGRSFIRVLKYLAVTLVTGLINVGLYWFVFDVVGVNYLLSQIFVTAVIAVLNFAGNMRFTFGIRALGKSS